MDIRAFGSSLTGVGESQRRTARQRHKSRATALTDESEQLRASPGAAQTGTHHGPFWRLREAPSDTGRLGLA
jgi:hypothetical protein